ncbi:ABC transporter permease/substrate-binding protein [Loigolactobacillus coryniformis]|uniref:Glycine betaine/carnitine/choline ABC transporter, substrate binding and permease protein n=1 Tax=Loigolactobacillus coryniformis subsp. coryniformis CECT 5711 TaxID=1185325 RepID=J2Z049_9LACO|nr:ABC transporter permease/substrate-binding protein [Loigolactobacillus coryniformis]EJN53778.1 Glycine betaine/carnitine/choline ABC transporter, substrate binding and permease protein [Loigolactobacillus coryniformis subsp. coryniformis CECT 5711]MBW4802971.1 ABC transporter permease/substrate-binding protein [Loigolactobacillus coryniformis subsp. torquens]MBW4805667.1 ABC transporter permease/substrate-binding protein [Loigolactobacillus coryniformis subsp. torquens]
MANFLQTLVTQRAALLTALGQHLLLSVISLAIAIVIALPLAIWVIPRPKTANVFLQLASVLQTIPSLALLGMLIPLVGIGSVPAVISLVVYALLPIFQNTYTGLTEIDPSLEEAATAFGMTRWEKLRKVELPLAFPMILSGIRTALVMIIGTATLAALIGAGGLGTFILLGINRNNNTMTLIGALASALLAIVLSLALRGVKRIKIKPLLITLAVVVVGCGGFGVYRLVRPQPVEITIAGKLGSEPEILINMYRDLIESDNDNVKVTLKPNFGQTSFLFSALKSKQITLYPEFTGTVLESLVKKPTKTATSANGIYQQAKTALQKQDDLTYLAPLKYNNTYALVVKRSFANKYDVHSISDLAKVKGQINAGFDLEFLDRTDGYKGIQQRYGLSFKTQSMSADLRYEALQQDKVNVTDGYSTDSQIRQYDLVVLKDDRHLFPTYQGAPLLRTATAKAHPEIVRSLNRLQGKISAADMQEMNYQVNVKRKSAAKVAHQYLVTHHLLGGDR